MPQHIGVDIIEIARVKKASLRWGERFLTRVFTTGELALFRSKNHSLAARFAAKEAILKALDARNAGISWQDIEILATTRGKPYVSLKNEALSAADRLAVKNIDISLSHSKDHAIAFVIAGS